jgi:SAM-dependent methyltransferase
VAITIPQFPKSSCAYEVYDPETLKPQNDSTYTRLIELGWTRQDFEGKSVLDIGSNSGILSLYAHKLGAVDIYATDVQDELVDFFSTVVDRHQLPIRVENKAFWDLDPNKDAADIVLFMEVLHWVVDQGGKLSEALSHVAALTRQTLYIETPWDINEPSIARKGVVKEADYNVELIFRELSRHFADVRIVRFMTYFGNMQNSKRVLIRASGRRDVSVPLTRVRNANLVDISLVRGPNKIELVTTTLGPKVIKTVSAGSSIARLDDEDFESLCGFLNDIRQPTIVPPEKIDAAYRHRGEDGKTYMLFPFAGRLEDVFPTRLPPAAPTNIMETAVQLRRELAHAPLHLIESLKSVCAPATAVDPDFLCTGAVGFSKESDEFEFCERVNARLERYDRSMENSLNHADMQLGNMLIDATGRTRLVDIDLMRTGTEYSDLLTCAIYNGASPDDVQRAIKSIQATDTRPVCQYDIDFSVAQTVRWFKTITALVPVVSDQAVTHFVAGIRMMSRFTREIAR